MAVHILDLVKFDKPVEHLATALDRWLFFLRHAEELDADSLPDPLDVPELRWASVPIHGRKACSSSSSSARSPSAGKRDLPSRHTAQARS